MIGLLKKTRRDNFTSTDMLTLCQLYESFNHLSFFFLNFVLFIAHFSHMYFFLLVASKFVGQLHEGFNLFFLFFFLATYGQTLVTSYTFGYFLFPCSFSW